MNITITVSHFSPNKLGHTSRGLAAWNNQGPPRPYIAASQKIDSILPSDARIDEFPENSQLKSLPAPDYQNDELASSTLEQRLNLGQSSRGEGKRRRNSHRSIGVSTDEDNEGREDGEETTKTHQKRIPPIFMTCPSALLKDGNTNEAKSPRKDMAPNNKSEDRTSKEFDDTQREHLNKKFWPAYIKPKPKKNEHVKKSPTDKPQHLETGSYPMHHQHSPRPSRQIHNKSENSTPSKNAYQNLDLGQNVQSPSHLTTACVYPGAGYPYPGYVNSPIPNGGYPACQIPQSGYPGSGFPATSLDLSKSDFANSEYRVSSTQYIHDEA